MRCMNTTLCTKQGTKIIVTDLNNNNRLAFVLSSRAFRAMAYKGMDQDVLKLGLVDVEYKRLVDKHDSTMVYDAIMVLLHPPH